jgi:hypothetical protein
MLPAVRTDEEWQAVVWDEKIVRPAAEDLAARLGLAGAELRRYPEGSRPVYAVGNRRVLKLYPTVSAPDSVTEARVLDYLCGRLPVATPELLAHCDPRLLGRILAAYGRGFDPRELLAYKLLHLHSNLSESLRDFPAPAQPTLDSPALTWFGTA